MGRPASQVTPRGQIDRGTLDGKRSMCLGGHWFVIGVWGGTLVMHRMAKSPSTSVIGPVVSASACGAPCQERLMPRALWRGRGLRPVFPRAKRSWGGGGRAICRQGVGRQGWHGLLMLRLLYILRGVDRHKLLGLPQLGFLGST